MLQGRPVAVLGGVRIPFCRQNTAYSDVGNLGMSVRTLGALVEKFGLHGQQLGEVAMGAVIKHSSEWNLGREATLSSGLSALTPGITLQRACGTSLDSIITIGNRIATGQIDAGIGGGSDTTSDVPIVYGQLVRRRLLQAARAKTTKERLAAFKGFHPRELKPEFPGVVEPRTGKSMGEHCEDMARQWAIARFAGRLGGGLAPQARGGIRARILRRPRRQFPWRCARQHAASGYLDRETGDAQAGLRPHFRPWHAHRWQFDSADRRRCGVPAVDRGMGARSWPRTAVPPARRTGRGGRFRARGRPADGADDRGAGNAPAQRADAAGFRCLRNP